MFSLGGYILINTTFTSSLQSEIARSKEENKMLCVMLERTVVNPPYNGEIYANTVQELMNSINVSTSSATILLRISDDKYNRIYENGITSLESNILEHVSVENSGYEIIEADQNYYINMANLVQLDNQTIYLENFREVTSVFAEKESQYTTFQKLMIGLIFINGLIIFMISMWLTLPIKRLSKATKLMADGDFSKRVRIKNKDEIGMLSNDFNIMGGKLEQSISEIKESARRQEDFVASFAHELKTPLTSIIGYADMMRSKRMSEEQYFIFSNHIFNEGKRLEALSLKLMEMVVLKKQTFPMKKVQIKKLIKEVQSVMFPVLKKEGIEFIVSAEKAVITLEPDLIKTVIINLIDNGKKAIENKGTVYLVGRCTEDSYKIYVLDNGRGIPEEEISKITEAFYMVDKSRARAEGGAGLGLSICSEIIKLHNAKMDVKSIEGRGTEVSILFKREETE